MIGVLNRFYNRGFLSRLKLAGDKEIPFQTPTEETNAHP
jgi:hypothetical protein